MTSPAPSPTPGDKDRSIALTTPGPGFRGRFRAASGLPLDQAASIVRTGGSLVATFLATSALGFVFWWLAARTFSPAAVGLASAGVSAMLLLARLTSHGLGTAIAGALASHRRGAASLVAPGVLVAAAVSAIFGLAFALLAPALSAGLAPLAQPVAAAAFAGGVALTAVNTVLDQAAIGLLRGGLQLLRNVVFATSKLVLLVAVVGPASDTGVLIIGVWVAGEALSLGVLAPLIARRASRPVAPDWDRLRSLGRDAIGHHVLNVARFAPPLAIPLVVATEFSTEANGLFYVAYLLASVTQLISSSATFAVYAVAKRHPDHLPHQLRLTLALSLVTVIPSVVVLTIAGGLVLGLFGPRYAAEAGSLVPLLALLALPLVVKDHWIAVIRIGGNVARGATLTTLAAAVELGAAIVGGQLGGLEGLAVGWLAGATLCASFQAPTVLRAAGIVRRRNTP